MAEITAALYGFLCDCTVFVRRGPIHDVTLAVDIAERLVFEFTVGELLFARTHEIFSSWNRAWIVVCIWIVDRQPAVAKAKILASNSIKNHVMS